MKQNSLRRDYGHSMNTIEVAAFFGVAANTVRKYPHYYGGVKVAPNRFRFFENIIRKILSDETDNNANYAAILQRGNNGRRTYKNKKNQDLGKRHQKKTFE